VDTPGASRLFQADPSPSSREARRRLRLPRAHAGRRPCHRRCRHGLRAHGAGARRRRLPDLAQEQGPARSGRHRHDHPRDRRSRRRLLRPRAAVRRPQGARDRGQEAGQVRPGQPGGDRKADRGRKPAGPRPAGAQLSDELEVQGAGDLPQHAAVVHPHGRAVGGRPHPARDGAAVDRRHRLPPGHGPQPPGHGPQPHPRHGRDASGLADQPSARLGHAAGHVRRQGYRRTAARRGRQQAHRRPGGEGGGRRLVPAPGQRLPRRARPRAVREDQRHPRCLVRLGRDPRLHHRGPGRQEAGPTATGRPTSISRAATSIAAGSSPRCWSPRAPAVARPTRPS